MIYCYVNQSSSRHFHKNPFSGFAAKFSVILEYIDSFNKVFIQNFVLYDFILSIDCFTNIINLFFLLYCHLGKTNDDDDENFKL